MIRIEPGRRIRIIGGLLEGMEATVTQVHSERGSITAAIERNDIPHEHRHRYYLNRKGYVPVEVLEEEFEVIGQRSITYPKDKE